MKHGAAYIAIIAVAVVAATAGYLYLHSYTGNSQTNSTLSLNSEFPVGRISINGSSYNVYVANTLTLQELGYMNSTGIGNCNGLGNCAGMLFVLGNDARQCFWMKNTLIALKQSWIDKGIVNYTYVGAPLSNAIICSPGNMVLETMPSFPINVSDNVSFLGFLNQGP